MSLALLNSHEYSLVLECLQFIVSKSEFDDDNTHSRLGVTQAEIWQLINTWSEVDDTVALSVAHIAIHNSLNEVCNGVSFTSERWKRWFSVPQTEICRVFEKYLSGDPGGII